MTAVPVLTARAAVDSDRAALWTLYQQAMRAHIEQIWGWNEVWQQDYFDNAWSGAATYVIEIDGVFGGYYQLEQREQQTYLCMLILAPHFRSQGFGARMLARLREASAAKGCGLRLRVFKVNSAAKRFYLREGWSVVGEDEAGYFMEPGI